MHSRPHSFITPSLKGFSLSSQKLHSFINTEKRGCTQQSIAVNGHGIREGGGAASVNGGGRAIHRERSDAAAVMHHSPDSQ